jgi:hypothetical protein
MKNDESDFINSPVAVHKSILGIGTTKQAMKQGTVRWSIQEFFTIPNTFYLPDLPIRLLLPQLWSQANAHLEAHSNTDAHRITLEWGDHIKTIPLNTSNIGLFWSATGYNKAKPVLQALIALLHEERYCMEAHLIPSNDEPSEEPSNQESISLPTVQPDMPPLTTVLKGDADTDNEPHVIEFDLEHLPLVKDENTSTSRSSCLRQPFCPVVALALSTRTCPVPDNPGHGTSRKVTQGPGELQDTTVCSLPLR